MAARVRCRPRADKRHAGRTQYVMACLGACSSFGSLLFGRVSDKFGRLPTLALAGLFHGTGAP